ncbi:MAG: methyltransferase domain-containing protein [Thermoplasmata archaeon]|nr:MAG: methyltransferase domain-containing protein [Thermoplasmata archaeon]
MSSRTDEVTDRVRKERRFWSKVAPDYDEWVAEAYADQYVEFRGHLQDALGPEDRVLEVGTGTGNIALHIAPHVRSVVGVDISPEMVGVARGKLDRTELTNVEFEVGDAYDLPFKDGSFDRVVFVNVLQTMKSPERAVKEAHRVLREGGEVVSVTYTFGDSSSWETFKLAKWVLRFGKPSYWSRVRAIELTEYFTDLGFAIVENERIWESPTVQLVRARR